MPCRQQQVEVMKQWSSYSLTQALKLTRKVGTMGMPWMWQQEEATKQWSSADQVGDQPESERKWTRLVKYGSFILKAISKY